MVQCIASSFVNDFLYPSHAVLLRGSLTVSSIVPLVEGFHKSIRAVLLVGVLVGQLVGVLVGLHIILSV